MSVAPAALATFGVAVLLYHLFSSLFFSPLSRIPGPKSFALARAKLAYEDYRGTRTRKIHALHKNYGRSSASVLMRWHSTVFPPSMIYGAGSGFERTGFYPMFEAYGRKNMFSFSSDKEHAERKKLFAHAYAKSATLKGDNATVVEHEAKLFLDLLEKEGPTSKIFSTLALFLSRQYHRVPIRQDILP